MSANSESSKNSNKKPVIVLTGFGPFEDHPVNSSWEAVRTLRDLDLWEHPKYDLLIEELPVSYDFVKNQLPDQWKNKGISGAEIIAVVNVGVSKQAKRLVLETQAANCGYERQDVLGQCPKKLRCVDCDDDKTLKTALDVEKLVDRVNKSSVPVECESSCDAGRYLCEFVFYKSMHCFNNKALFVHVPDLKKVYTKEDLAGAICVVLQGIAEQIDGQ